MNVKSFIDPRRWHSPSYLGSTYPRLELTPPPCHHATRPTSERGRSLFREANLYVHPLCTRVCEPPRLRCSSTFSVSSSVPLVVPRIRISRRCVREFRNEHRIYGLARLDSIPFASSPAIPLDFVRLQTAPLSNARLSDQSS